MLNVAKARRKRWQIISKSVTKEWQKRCWRWWNWNKESGKDRMFLFKEGFSLEINKLSQIKTSNCIYLIDVT